MTINQSQMVSMVAEEAGITKVAASDALKAFAVVVERELKKGGEVVLPGCLGKLHITESAARTGRNPATGAEIEIPSKKVPKYKPGKGIKDLVNS